MSLAAIVPAAVLFVGTLAAGEPTTRGSSSGAGVAASPAAGAPSPAEAFERGRVAFDRGEYARAIELLRPQLYPHILFDEESQVVRSHRMLGVAHLFEGQTQEARYEFLRLLELRPDYRFDPLLDPPRVVDFFNEILREQEAQIAAIEQRRRSEEAARRKAEAMRTTRIVERQIVRNSMGVALIPFGAGQFQNGHRRKGWAFLTAEAVLGGVSVAAFATNFLVYGASYQLSCGDVGTAAGSTQACDPGQIDRGPERRSDLLLNVQLVSGGLFFAVAAWGVVDALIHFEPLVYADGPPGLGRPQPAKPRISLAPTVVGKALGPGVAIRF